MRRQRCNRLRSFAPLDSRGRLSYMNQKKNRDSVAQGVRKPKFETVAGEGARRSTRSIDDAVNLVEGVGFIYTLGLP